MSRKLTHAILLIAAGAMVTGASAHMGTDPAAHAEIGFADGLQHPFTGLDHLAAMLAVGFWSALSARRLWSGPLAFAAMLLAGAVMGLAGMALPAVEPMIAASLLVLGLLVALRTRLPAALAASLVGLFAIFHGVAHGTELAGAANILAPLSGMLLATLALHAIGLGLGLSFRPSTWGSRLAGTGVAALGLTLLVRLA
ncbi:MULTISPECIES: HupE/UreJ family protein [unclassified Polaromonas]|uniref:HupE/UreJ family protein n=1 Tax=unclassified Polaromonas TaxID=2638319 RepID=UPI0018C8E0D2|nr:MULTISPECIES: HupE/UreJ family protein [unclassified Polaromonas]MBG6073406.1 urease accessory protein [Polaromonas sp. CG_9.7]MBG6115409.1 urease accessory protein [Polaromonas sp. CG_9.2]MDH6186127.1 urease accessory protein [Polaromonas sp. CG_23.6]